MINSSTKSNIQSICIVRLSALGDVLMLVPLIRTLQASYPQARITWVISKPAYYLVEDLDGIDFVVIDKPKTPADYWRFYKQMRSRRFDVLLAAQASFRANLLYPLIHAERKIGYDKLRAKDGHHLFIHETITPGCDHTLEGFLKFADALRITKKIVSWDLPISADDLAWASAQIPKGDGPLLIVNPAASKPERSWPVARYVEVILHAKAQWNARVVLTGGPGEYDKQLGESISRCADVTNLIGKTKPKQLLALISQANLVICPDTGPSHMACAVGTPVIALHAVTSAAVSGPYTFRHLAVDCYPEAVIRILNKTPETNIWGTHAHGLTTMELITVDAVVSRLDDFIRGFAVCD